jgi:hypothetical protein
MGRVKHHWSRGSRQQQCRKGCGLFRVEAQRAGTRHFYRYGFPGKPLSDKPPPCPGRSPGSEVRDEKG